MSVLPAAEWMPRGTLAYALAAGDPRFAALARGADGDETALFAAARDAAARHIDRALLAETLVAGLADVEAPARAVAAARRLGDSSVVAVVTGQQPGLLGGPGLVLTKALAAAATAARLEAAGFPAVPVFWHASEDHDHGEADHVRLTARDGESFERLQVPLPEDGRTLAATPVPAEAEDVVARAAEMLPDGPGREPLLALLAPRDGDTFGRWTGRFLAGLLGPLGVVVVEPHRLRSLAASVTEHELQRPHALHALLAETLARVTAAGLPPPLELPRRELLFLLEDGVRRAFTIDPAAGTYATADGRSGDLADLAARGAEAFSWNVAARVLAQDTALPVAAQVCGPSELGYVALLGTAHEALGLPQPAALLRPGLTPVPRMAARAARALGVDPVEVLRDPHGALPEALSEEAQGALSRLHAALDALPAGRSPGVTRRRVELVRQAELFAGALRREREELDAAHRRRRRRLVTALQPRGRLAERELSPLPWLAREGLEVLPRVRDLLDRLDGGHVVAELG